jgi:hypothetical protein
MQRDGRTGAADGGRRGRDEGQQIRVTVPLAGPQHITVTAHPRSEPGHGSVSMLLGRLLIIFHDRPAVDAMVKAWGDQARKAELLPNDAERSTPRASFRTASELAILVDATGPAPVSGKLIRPPGHTTWLQLQFGGVLFSVRDIEAFGTTTAALRKVAELAQTSLAPAEPGPAHNPAVATTVAALAAPRSGTAPRAEQTRAAATPAAPRPSAAPAPANGT